MSEDTFGAVGLPPGVSISSSGVLSGTVRSVAADATYAPMITATVPFGDSLSATMSVTVTNVPEPSGGGGGGGGSVGIELLLVGALLWLRRRRVSGEPCALRPR